MSIFCFCFFGWWRIFLWIVWLESESQCTASTFMVIYLASFFFPRPAGLPIQIQHSGNEKLKSNLIKITLWRRNRFYGGGMCVVEPSPICREIQIDAPLKSRQFRRGDVSRRNVVNLNPHHLVAHNRVIWANNHVSPWVPKMRNERHSSTRREIDR
jgi:hypothetical protein